MIHKFVTVAERSECGFVPPQRRQVAAYGRARYFAMRIARIDGWLRFRRSGGFKHVEGAVRSRAKSRLPMRKVIDESAGENRGPEKKA